MELHYKGVIAMEFYPTGDVVETLRRSRQEALRAWGNWSRWLSPGYR